MLPGPGQAPLSPDMVSRLHTMSDVDSSRHAQHHTLGTGAGQAAPGDVVAGVQKQQSTDTTNISTLQAQVATLNSEYATLASEIAVMPTNVSMDAAIAAETPHITVGGDLLFLGTGTRTSHKTLALPDRVGQLSSLFSDANTAVSSGWYMPQVGAVNIPAPEAGSTAACVMLVLNNGNNYVRQEFYDMGASPGGIPQIVKYERQGVVPGSWSSWARVLLSPVPAFCVRLSADYTKSGTSTTTLIPFDTEIADNGNNFNLSTHLFTAPVTGVYEFTASLILSTTTGGPLGGFSKNGVMPAPPWDFGDYSNSYFSSSVTVIENMNAGDTMGVGVNNANNTTITFAYDYGNRFSGRLIQ